MENLSLLNKKSLILIFLVIYLSACKTYSTFNTLNLNSTPVQTVAILPFKINSNRLIKKDEGYEELKKKERSTALELQADFYAYFSQNKDFFTIKFQDVSVTNQILDNQGITYDDLKNYSGEDLAKILKVDAVVISKIMVQQSPQAFNKVANNVFWWGTIIGGTTTTGKVLSEIRLLSATNSALLWQYNKQIKMKLMSSSQNLLNNIAYEAPRKFPYQIKKNKQKVQSYDSIH